MFYLISNDNIVQTAQTTFEVHEDLIWVEAEEAPAGYSASYKDGQIVFEEIVVYVPDRIMTSKVSRDAIFCIGELVPNKGFININKEGGTYNQYVVLIEGSGDAINTVSNDKVLIENAGMIYDVASFKNSPINYNSYDNGAKWVAVNPVNVESLDVTSIAGPVNQTIIDNTDGITVFNAKGEVIVNGTSLNLNEPAFYHANNQLDIQVSNDSYAILVRY